MSITAGARNRLEDLPAAEAAPRARRVAGFPTVTQAVVVPCEQGLHLRVASVLVSTAKAFDSEIRLMGDRLFVDAKSILDVLRLGAVKGTPLFIVAKGPDAEDAVQVLANFFGSTTQGGS